MDINLTNPNRLYQWTNDEPSDTYITQEFPCGFEKTSVVFKNEDNIFECLHCLLIPRFSLVFKCGHPTCHRCFPEFFKRSPKCNYCRTPVQIEEVLTFAIDRQMRPGSLTAKMYYDAMIHCTNIGCKLEFNINEINNHEYLKCPYRVIKCPAKGCDYKGEPNQVHQHALQCPFIQVYCGTCFGAFGVEVIEHSCAMML